MNECFGTGFKRGDPFFFDPIGEIAVDGEGIWQAAKGKLGASRFLPNCSEIIGCRPLA
jgi:hypothetical protein